MSGDATVAGKREKPGGVAKPRRLEALHGNGQSVDATVRQIDPRHRTGSPFRAKSGAGGFPVAADFAAAPVLEGLPPYRPEFAFALRTLPVL